MMNAIHYFKVFALVLCFSMSTSHADIIDIDIIDFSFSPADVNIQVGDTVRWTNRNAVTHTSTSGAQGIPDGMWNSGSLGLNESFSFVFETPGSFPYYCIPHNFMTGTVNVSAVTISPPSGDYISSQGFDVSLIVNSSTAVVTSATVIFDGVNQTALFQGCSVIGALDDGGQTFRCPGIINGLSTGVHTLDISVTMSDGSILSDSVVWQVQGTTE